MDRDRHGEERERKEEKKERKRKEKRKRRIEAGRRCGAAVTGGKGLDRIRQWAIYRSLSISCYTPYSGRESESRHTPCTPTSWRSLGIISRSCMSYTCITGITMVVWGIHGL